MSMDDFTACLDRVQSAIQQRSQQLAHLPTTSTPTLIAAALDRLPSSLPSEGLGLQGLTHSGTSTRLRSNPSIAVPATTDLLLDAVCPALAGGSSGPRFYGLVTGGVHPAAQLADHLVTSYDPCVQVHRPVSSSPSFPLVLEPPLTLQLGQDETISTILETQALSMLLSLLSLSSQRFTSNTFTTGATASNILGLCLGREHAIAQVQRRRGIENWSCAEDGFGDVGVDVFGAAAHLSLSKAASLCGIGRRNVHEVQEEGGTQLAAFDLVELEKRLKANVGRRGSIVVTSFGEVNTGAFTPHTNKIRQLCDNYDAWLHIDAAFGAFGVLHPEFSHMIEDLALADSITSDAHKWLNAPYDCGIFLSRSTHLQQVCGPGGTALTYLASAPSTNSIFTTSSNLSSIDAFRSLPPPLFVNIENSRRARALPVWASLISLGKSGFAEIFIRNIEFARKVEAWMRGGGGNGGYEILTPVSSTKDQTDFRTLNILLFAPSATAPSRFQGEGGAEELLTRINEDRLMYCSGTKWRGRAGIRLAVSNYGTELERDFNIVVGVLESVMKA